MSSLASSSSAISSSEEDVRERPQDDSKDKNDHQEAVESSDGADEKADTAGSDVEEENVDEKEDENDDKELVIEYTVELDQVEEKPNEKTDGSISSELKASENREATPTPESVKMEDHPSESKESPIEAPKTPVLIAIKAPPSPQVPSNSEVVEEVPRSVKEQIAIFSNLNLQKAHDTPKLGASSAFAIDHSNQNNVLSKSTLPASFTQAPRVATAYKNVSPQPFGTAETDLIKQADRQPTEHPPNQPDSTKFDRPQPLDRPSEPPPQPKKFVFKATTSTPPMTFCVPFGNGSQSVKSTESPVKEVSPSQYLGPGVIAQTSRPPMMIRLRRPGPEAPWGFAVFGGADYGCPPFISRVTLHSIAARAGLEVGDIVVSVCDSPVQEKEHSRIKAEILRAGNELDFTVINHHSYPYKHMLVEVLQDCALQQPQGIDKEILAQRAPHLLRTPAPPPAPGAAHTRQSIWATGTWTSPTSPNYPDKATRTRSFRLLDEHLNAMSAQPPSPLKVTTSQPSRVFSPTQSYHFESASRSSYAMGQNHHTTGMSNYGRTNRTIYPSTHSPNTSHGFYAQSQPVSTSRTAFTAPTGFSQGSGAWRNTSPTRVGYDSFASPSRPGTWSSSTNQQMDYYESRNTVERSSTDDPGLMTQYYGTQQTCYAKYHPQSQQHQQRMLHQGSSYQSTSEWSRVSPQQSLPTSRLVYRPQGTNFTTAQGAKEQFRHHQFQQQQQNFVSASNYQDQERWTTAGWM